MRRRRNLLWGGIALAVSLAVLANSLEVIPAGLYDILVRSLPALLILFGLSVLLRKRVPLADLAALLLTGLVVAAIAATAFTTRATQQRSDHVETIRQAVGADVTLLALSLDVLATDVEIRLIPSVSASIAGEFVGSLESMLNVVYTEEAQGRAVLTITETRPNPFPNLEAVGRGELALELPSELAVDLVVNGQQGLATLDLTGIALERLTLNWQQGDAVVTLPEYQPRSPNAEEQPGQLNVRDGDLSVLIPDAVGASFRIVRGSGVEPVFDETVYFRPFGDTLETRGFQDFDITIRYQLDVPSGSIRVEPAP